MASNWRNQQPRPLDRDDAPLAAIDPDQFTEPVVALRDAEGLGRRLWSFAHGQFGGARVGEKHRKLRLDRRCVLTQGYGGLGSGAFSFRTSVHSSPTR
jgi:hypothetical protein